MIEVDEQFSVSAPAAAVWEVLADPYVVVECVPGAAIVGQGADGAFDTLGAVRVGPMSVAFQARALLSLVAEERTGRIEAKGKDKLGGARFVASVMLRVPDQPSGGVGAVHSEVEHT